MSFFKGQETFSLDNKGRVNIPAKMRKVLSPDANDTFVLTRGTDKCIVAYPLNEWKKYEERYAGMNQFDEENRFFLRTILAWCEEVEIDAQQRITIGKRYLDFASLEGKVTVVGMIDHIEFWNPDEFEHYLNGHGDQYEQIAAKVMQS